MESFDIVFTGKLVWVSDDWPRLEIIQNDGYRVNLLSRFQEIGRSFGKKGISCSYFTSDKLMTEDEAVEGLVKRCAGVLEVAQDVNSYSYSEYTSGTDYEQDLKIGNHDLFQELQPHVEKFIVFRIHVLPTYP